MKLHKAVKKLLKQGFNDIQIMDGKIAVIEEHRLGKDELDHLFETFDRHYYMELLSGEAGLIINMVKKDNEL